MLGGIPTCKDSEQVMFQNTWLLLLGSGRELDFVGSEEVLIVILTFVKNAKE